MRAEENSEPSRVSQYQSRASKRYGSSWKVTPGLSALTSLKLLEHGGRDVLVQDRGGGVHGSLRGLSGRRGKGTRKPAAPTAGSGAGASDQAYWSVE